MKTVFIAMLIFTANFTTNDESKYQSAMSTALESLYQSQSAEDFQSAANKFERIAQAESDKWHPAYYASLSYLWKVNQLKEGEEIDRMLDEAQRNLDVSKQIAPKEDEIIALQGYIHMMRITVDPANRGPKLSGKSMGEFQKALAIDPENPRALMLMGQMKYGTAQFFGDDTSEACEMIKNAVNMLEKEQPAEKFSPAWGKQMASFALKECQ